MSRRSVSALTGLHELSPRPEPPTHVVWKFTWASRVKAGPTWSAAEGKRSPSGHCVQMSWWPPSLKQGLRGTCVTVLGRCPLYNLPSEAQGQSPKLRPQCGRTWAHFRHTLADLPLRFAEPGARENMPHIEKHTFLSAKLKNMGKALTFIRLKVDRLLKMIEFNYYCTCLGVLLGSQ